MNQETKTTENKIKLVLLSDNGPVLPIGTVDTSGVYHKDLEIRPWRMKEETELGDVMEQQQNIRFGKYVTLVLSKMCTKLGMYDFTSMNDIEKAVVVGQMYMADILFAYLWLRIQSMGHKMPVEMWCPNCRHNFMLGADLRTVEIRTIETIEDAEWGYKLRQPFQIRNINVEEFIIRPPRWVAIEAIKGQTGRNFGKLKLSIIHGSVFALGGQEPLPLASHEFDEMRKIDFETLTMEIDQKTIGPDFSIEASCPECNFKFKNMIQWASEDFFGVSSRSKA